MRNGAGVVGMTGAAIMTVIGDMIVMAAVLTGAKDMNNSVRKSRFPRARATVGIYERAERALRGRLHELCLWRGRPPLRVAGASPLLIERKTHGSDDCHGRP